MEKYKKRFIDEMDDDFHTANAITTMFEFVKEGNRYLDEANTSTNVLDAMLQLFEEWGRVLGVAFIPEEELLDEEVDTLIQQRKEARENRQFQKADEIRDQLTEKGIILEDTAQGTRWKRG